MDFVGAIKSGFQNYSNFKGVAGRAEYWYWFLFTVLVNIVTNFVDTVTDTGVISTVVTIGLLLPNLAVLFRRLRDAGYKSTWGWLTIALSGLFFVLLIAVIVALFAAGMDLNYLMNPDLITDEMMISWFGNPLVLGLGVLMIVEGLAVIVLTITVNIVFCLQPSKSFAEGNKYVSPENPII